MNEKLAKLLNALGFGLGSTAGMQNDALAKIQNMRDQATLDQAVYGSGNTPLVPNMEGMSMMQLDQAIRDYPDAVKPTIRDAYMNMPRRDMSNFHGGLLSNTPEGNQAYRQLNDYQQQLMMRLRDPSLDPETRKQLLQALSGLQ